MIMYVQVWACVSRVRGCSGFRLRWSERRRNSSPRCWPVRRDALALRVGGAPWGSVDRWVRRLALR
jgi:hypothetical protein